MSPALGATRMKQSVSMPSLHTAGVGIVPQFTIGGDVGGGVDLKDPKRQRRLERNRESARLSRRRRKQYLEVLEEKVNVLSEQMDGGRRQHVLNAIDDIKRVRKVLVDEASALNPSDVAAVGKSLQQIDGNTSSSCRELRLALQFYNQQFKSLVLPPQTRFILWLTLQNDGYYLGGRDSSQRLSAARIGEKLLLAGRSKASPAGGMWPLLCNDTGLSYDQEEKVRAYQRSTLQDQQSWMDRHAVGAITNNIETTYNVLKGLGALVEGGFQEESTVLSMQQRLRFLKYCSDNKERLQKYFRDNAESEAEFAVILQTLNQYSHDSMKLGALTNVLNNVQNTLPAVPDVVQGGSLKKLSRRPSFESLASATIKNENSSSSNNLVDMVTPVVDGPGAGKKDPGQCISPEAAQSAFVGGLMGGGSGGQRGAGHHFFPHKQQPGFVQVAGVGPVKVQGENTVTPEVGMWDGGYGGGGFAGVGVERISEENTHQPNRQKVDSMEVLDMVLNDIDLINNMQPGGVGGGGAVGGDMGMGIQGGMGGVPNSMPMHQPMHTSHGMPAMQVSHAMPMQGALHMEMMGMGAPVVDPSAYIPPVVNPAGVVGGGAEGDDVDELMQTLGEEGFLFDIAPGEDDDWTIGGFADKSP